MSRCPQLVRACALIFLLGGVATAAVAEAAPVSVLQGADQILDLPFEGLYGQPIWDTRSGRDTERLAIEVTDHRAQASARVVILEGLQVDQGRVTVAAARAIPAHEELVRAGLDARSVDVRQLVWDPGQVCDFLVRSNGLPISVGGLPAWFRQPGPKAPYTERWSRMAEMLPHRADFLWTSSFSDGVLVFSVRETTQSASDLFALRRPDQLVRLTETADRAEILPIPSPDGKLMALSHVTEKGVTQLAVVRLGRDESDMPILAESPTRIETGYGAAWSPVDMGEEFGGARLLAYYRRGAPTPEGRPVFDLCLLQVPLTGRIRKAVARRVVAEDVIVNTEVVGANPPAWSSDGRYLFFVRYDGAENPVCVIEVPQVEYFDVPAPYQFWSLATDTALNMFVALSPNEDMLAVVAVSSQVVVASGAGNRPHWPYVLALDWAGRH